MFSNQKIKYFSIGFVAALAATAFYLMPMQNLLTLMVPSAYAAGSLTNVRVSNSNNLFDTAAWYVVSFRTASTGTIETIEMTFPSGFDVSQVRRIENSGIPDGTLSASGQAVTYTVGTPVSIPNNTLIKITMERIVNGESSSNVVSVTTRDGSNNIIDGPTNSATFSLVGCIDSPTFCVDPINNRVGIGSDPSTTSFPLSVKGSGTSEQLISFRDPSGTTQWHINQNLTGTRPGLNFAETGVADGRLFIEQGGNIGIGTTNPESKLQIGSRWGFSDGTEKVILYNAFVGGSPSVERYLTSGTAGALRWDPANGFYMQTAPSGSAGAAISWDDSFKLVESSVLDATVPFFVSNTNKGRLVLDSETEDSTSTSLIEYAMGHDAKWFSGAWNFNGRTDYRIQQADNTSFMLFSEDGHLGIGSENPGAHLTIDGDGVSGIFITGGTGGSIIMKDVSNGKCYQLYMSNGVFVNAGEYNPCPTS